MLVTYAESMEMPLPAGCHFALEAFYNTGYRLVEVHTLLLPFDAHPDAVARWACQSSKVAAVEGQVRVSPPRHVWTEDQTSVQSLFTVLTWQ